MERGIERFTKAVWSKYTDRFIQAYFIDQVSDNSDEMQKYVSNLSEDINTLIIQTKSCKESCDNEIPEAYFAHLFGQRQPFRACRIHLSSHFTYKKSMYDYHIKVLDDIFLGLSNNPHVRHLYLRLGHVRSNWDTLLYAQFLEDWGKEFSSNCSLRVDLGDHTIGLLLAGLLSFRVLSCRGDLPPERISSSSLLARDFPPDRISSSPHLARSVSFM